VILQASKQKLIDNESTVQDPDVPTNDMIQNTDHDPFSTTPVNTSASKSSLDGQISSLYEWIWLQEHQIKNNDDDTKHSTSIQDFHHVLIWMFFIERA
jgi:hypothetical protein